MARTGTAVLELRDFSGGLNLRDSPTELAGNESPDLYNVTLDERGGVAKRLGSAVFDGAPAGVTNLFFWPKTGRLIFQAGATVYDRTSVGVFVTVHAYSTAARVAFAEFGGKLCITHPVDGFGTWDGAAYAAVATGPKADAMAVWQNKLWTNDAVTPARVNFSAAGDPTNWATAGAGTIDIREIDEAQVVAIGVSGGQDIIGKPGLMVFKARSHYRITDSTTGSYVSLDPQIGAMSALAVTSLFGEMYFLSERGIFRTHGTGRAQPVGDKLAPLWSSSQLNLSQVALACAGSFGNRVYFSLPQAGQTQNTLMLEYSPLQGWLTANSNAATCYARFSSGTDNSLLTGSTAPAGQVGGGLILKQFTGGLDIGSPGVPIVSYFQTPWIQPAGGTRAILQRLRTNCRGFFDLYVRRDYEAGTGTRREIGFASGSSFWNSGVKWNDPGVVWGPTNYSGFSKPDEFSLGIARAFSFRAQETSQLTQAQPAKLGNPSPTVGAWALYGLDLYTVPLGPS